MKKNIHNKKLLVEGDEDKRVIPYLIEANGINWNQTKNTPIVYIEAYNGINKLLDPDVIYTELNQSGLTTLGLIVDANSEPLNRWKSIYNVCLASMPDFPQDLPSTGLIHHLTNGKKFGVWMMPDNNMMGMLETFLANTIPSDQLGLWNYAQNVVKEAKKQGASFKEKHLDKSYIHTWLAWQDPPGRPLHNAVMEKILQVNNPQSIIFMNWFKSLYDL